MQPLANLLKKSLYALFMLTLFVLNGPVSPVNATPLVQDEPTDVTAISGHAFYLPLVLSDNGTSKSWSGIHLGNIKSDARYEWHPTNFWYINPTVNNAATWPAMIVVQSNQIYDIHRDADITGCPIIDASVRLPNAFQYLQAAAQAGSRIVIRITPSPGSFRSWATDPSDRRMVVINPLGVLKTWVFNDATQEYNLTDIPADFSEPTDCNHFHEYRSLRDIVDEIKAIYELNRSFGWTEYGFEPANEPNIEWFGAEFDNSAINRTKAVAWDMMDFYFLYLMLQIDELQNTTPAFQPRVFTPPMAQSEYEAGIWLEHCQDDRYFKDSQGNQLPFYSTGYERMRNAIDASHGFSWHNYWDSGSPFETYGDCNEDTELGGHHISYHFPDWLKEHLATSGKPLIISEADLLSPYQSEYRVPAIPNKGTQATATATSLRNFLQIEHRELAVQYPNNPATFALWLLNDNTRTLEDSPDDETCIRGACGLDHNWHEAYRDQLDQLQTLNYSDEEITRYDLPPGSTYTINDVEVRSWFAEWWNGAEE